jgi:hypothetical protein
LEIRLEISSSLTILVFPHKIDDTFQCAKIIATTTPKKSTLQYASLLGLTSMNNHTKAPVSDVVEMSETNNDCNQSTDEKELMVDIMPLLQSSVQSLSFESPMIHANSFNLQDSMAALEIMDWKMDCCEVPLSALSVQPTKTKANEAVAVETEVEITKPQQSLAGEEELERMVHPRPAPMGLDDIVDPLPWNELTLEDAAFIALENIVRLESLLSGASVVESTYTSLYAHKVVLEDMQKRLDTSMSLTEQMKAIMHPPSKKGTTAQHVVFASTLLLVELTELFRGVILNADIYEEEDFGSSTFNIVSFRRPSDSFTKKVVQNALAVVEEEVLKMEQRDNLDELETINLTLGFQLDLFLSVSSLAKLVGKTIRNDVEQAQVLIVNAKEKLRSLFSLITKMKAKQSNAVKVVIRRTFDSFVNRPLLGNAPIRMIEFRDSNKAVEEIERIVDELDWAVCNVILKANNLGRVRRMMGPISPSSTNILTRSLLVLNLYFDELIFGQHSLTELILRYMRQLSHVPDPITDFPATQAFLSRLCKPVYDTFKLMTLNRNRQRSYLDIMLGDWSALREEAYIADVTNHQDTGSRAEVQLHFSLYVLSTTIELMDYYVDVGLELELFANEHELTVAYWYRDFLTSSLLTQLNTMRRCKLDAKQHGQPQIQQDNITGSVKTNKGGKKKGKNKKTCTNGTSNNSSTSNKPSQPSSAPTVEDIEEEVEYLLLNVKRFLCRGLVRFFAALQQAGLVKENSYEFTSNEKIYQKRFEPFIGIHQPPLLAYADFLQGSDFSNISHGHLVIGSSDSFGAAKSLIDQTLTHMATVDTDFLPIQEDEVRQLYKVCLGNSIYLQRLKHLTSAGGNGDIKATVTLDMTTHKHFCIIKIS